MTTVTSTVSTRRLHIENNLPNEATLMLEGDGGLIDVDRDEFLAAVATELDVIVIPRSALPEVKDRHPGIVETQTFIYEADTDPATLRRQAHELFALAEHLEAHPPIDEAQVDALRHLMADAGNYGSVDGVPWAFARALVAAGVRAPQAGDDQ